MEYDVLQNYELLFIPKNYIIEFNLLKSTFNIDFNKSYKFIKHEIIKTL